MKLSRLLLALVGAGLVAAGANAQELTQYAAQSVRNVPPGARDN